MLNWILVDRETYQMKYGVQKVAENTAHRAFDYKTGGVSMTVTPSTGDVGRHEGGEKRIKFNNREGFVAAEEEDGVWKLYFDVDNDGLKRIKVGHSGKRNVEIDVIRLLAEEEKQEQDEGNE